MDKLLEVLGTSSYLYRERRQQFLVRALVNYDDTCQPFLRNDRDDPTKFNQRRNVGGTQHHIQSYENRGTILSQSTWDWLLATFVSNSSSKFVTCDITEYPHEWGIVSCQLLPDSRPKSYRHTLLHLPTRTIALAVNVTEVACSWACAETVAHGMGMRFLATHRYNNCLPCLVTRQDDRLVECTTDQQHSLPDYNCGFSPNGLPYRYAVPTLNYFLLYGPVTKHLLREALQYELLLFLHVPLIPTWFLQFILEFSYGEMTWYSPCSLATVTDWLTGLQVKPPRTWTW